ncbi:MAG: NAD(P)-binding domain-containing protein [Brevefilum sp.]|nr:NAD(P)-binding domain-containing protein [Brevefilum sp.]
MEQYIETIIVGGGQHGLSTSYCLNNHGREHVVLEKAPWAADAWRNRWDSFTLVTPNWMIRLPGAEYNGDQPDTFMDREQVVAYFEAYIERYNLPLRFGVEVFSVEPDHNGFLVKTSQGDFRSDNVVVAVGFYQQPRFPSFSKNCDPHIHQIHSDHYRNSGLLPTGPVLVVGSAQSGSQIAEELNESGRVVYLSVSTTGRFPRRYRGVDAAVWMQKMGYFERTVDQLPSTQARFAASAHGTGKNGGHTINLHQFARDGINLLGRLQNIEDNRAHLAPDLHENLAKADQFELEFVQEIDQYIQQNGLDVPEEFLPDLKDGFAQEQILDLDLKAAGIRNIVWATGYACDFSWVKLPVFDSDGLPVHQRGVTPVAGLYFIGMPFLHSGKSGLLYGAAEDATFIADRIATNNNDVGKIIRENNFQYSQRIG